MVLQLDLPSTLSLSDGNYPLALLTAPARKILSLFYGPVHDKPCECEYTFTNSA